MLDNLLSEVDVQRLRTLLDKAHNIIITCHVSPDGDAMGAVLAFSHFLWRKGKNAQPVVPNIFPDFLKWMPGVERVRIHEKHENEVAPLVAAADLIICLDFNAPDRLQGLQKPVMDSRTPKIMIDHHLDPVDFCDWTVSRQEMSSTCELLYRILVQLEGVEPMTYEEAVCLYTGMMTDTGCFSYNSNRSDIYYIIGRLLTKGIDKDKIYRNVFFNYSAERFRLMGYMLYVKLEYFPEYHASLMTLTREEQKRFSHRKGDTEGFVNIPLQIGKSRLSVFLREDTERHAIRVSLRSVDDFPCNRMAAEFFNGGGHLNASGGELSCTMDEAVQIVRKALKKYTSLLTDR
ncbi:DHH family phosphoesterase [Paraprevotella xylaniphila]|uniref:DHH family phosphoesterase n=1 Tax=Paraprevotella xylaniphila TaxID=454155 RepID=UPI00266B49A3|nr:DHH family phosphoesterase [Paraprevotella xylaniphila]